MRAQMQVIRTAALCGGVWLSASVLAQEPAHAHEQPQTTSTDERPPLPDMRNATPADAMQMGRMQGGRAPADARDPDAYSGGYEYSDMPGQEETDRLPFSRVFPEQFEFVSGDEGDGVAWDVQGAYGPDEHKLWIRTEGAVIDGKTDTSTGAEALWWRAFSPFWATQLGVRQDFGDGAHSYLALGVQGLAPYWFEVEATGYVGEDGRLAARFQASYDLLLTNRLILTPKIESDLYSRAEPDRDLGSGVSNVEVGVRLRYEITRKFAPYIGFSWDRALGSTADRLRAADEPVLEKLVVVGVRAWW